MRSEPKSSAPGRPVWTSELLRTIVPTNNGSLERPAPQHVTGENTMQIRRTTTVQNTNSINLKTNNSTSNVSSQNTVPVDQLEISAEAQALQSNNGIRTEKVAELREQIATGRYETAEKIDVAVERMLDEIA